MNGRRGVWGAMLCGVLVVLMLVVGLSLVGGSAEAREPMSVGPVRAVVNPSVVSENARLSIEAAAEIVPVPPGFTKVGSQLLEVGGDQAPEHLTVAEVKFNGPDRSAVTVMFIEGGDWDIERELSVASERSGVEVTIDHRSAALVEGEMSQSVSWLQSEGIIVQVVTRGGQITRDDLLSYAESVAKEGP